MCLARGLAARVRARPGGRAAGHQRRSRYHLVAPGVLGAVESAVGRIDPVLDRQKAGVRRRHANAGADAQMRVLAHAQLAQLVAYAQGHRIGIVQMGVHAQHGEFIASVAAGRVMRSQAVPDGQTDGLQHLVTHGVPKAVVDALEVVYVHDQQAGRGLRLPVVAQRGARLLPPVVAAVQRGQGVDAAEHLQLHVLSCQLAHQLARGPAGEHAVQQEQGQHAQLHCQAGLPLGRGPQQQGPRGGGQEGGEQRLQPAIARGRVVAVCNADGQQRNAGQCTEMHDGNPAADDQRIYLQIGVFGAVAVTAVAGVEKGDVRPDQGAHQHKAPDSRAGAQLGHGRAHDEATQSHAGDAQGIGAAMDALAQGHGGASRVRADCLARQKVLLHQFVSLSPCVRNALKSNVAQSWRSGHIAGLLSYAVPPPRSFLMRTITRKIKRPGLIGRLFRDLPAAAAWRWRTWRA